MVKLGQEVKDRITGFQGIAIGRTVYLQGCARVLVQPPLDKDGKMVEAASFDEPDIEVVGLGVLPKPKEDEPPGGPRPTATRAVGPSRKL